MTSASKTRGPPRPESVLPLELRRWIYEHKTTVAAGTASLIATGAYFPLDRSVLLLPNTVQALELKSLLLAGIIYDAGVCSVKSRLQVMRYNGFIDCVRKTYKHEGIQGFFRGENPANLTYL